MIDIETLSLRDITPPNIASDPQVSSLITALDPELQEISRATIEPLIMARIDELPENVLDLLAWQLHADFYDLAATLSMKREAVKGSILWHMHKGTEWAILEALRQIDIKAEFVPWYKYDGEPYTFKLTAIVSGDFYRTQGKDKLVSSIRRAVEESKAARSYMSELETRIEFTEHNGILLAGIPLLSGQRRMLLPAPPSPGKIEIFTGIPTVIQGQEIIRPAHEPDIEARIYAATIAIENRDINLGVDLDTMQELLQHFERRILAALDEYEKRTQNLINETQSQTNARLDAILDLLRWIGDDDEK